jgi:hypothetical protein
MSWLRRVIGTVLGTTQTVSPVCQTQDGLAGGENNTVGQPKPVRKELKPKRSNAKAVTQAQSRKAETSCVRTPTKKSLALGTQPATPVPQSAKQKPKRKPKVAQPTTAVKLSKLVKNSAQAEHGQIGKQLKTPVRPTPQAAKSALKRKP